jgi:hypothetical protein
MDTIKELYICPMHKEISQNKPGKCPKCGMKLLLQKDIQKTGNGHQDEPNNITGISDYIPLLIIISLILLVTAVLSLKDFNSCLLSLQNTMRYFMAGFFLVFSGFKLLDVKGFEEGYSTYDLLAKRVFSYGYLYPFLELGLGLAYVVGYMSVWVILLTFFLMTFSRVGGAIKILKKERFQCACLGTFLKIPLTKVTLIEDFGMVIMARMMFFVS